MAKIDASSMICTDFAISSLAGSGMRAPGESERKALDMMGTF
jgi:hypothetical protein